MINESQPLVSIVTPSFNQVAFLEDTLLSVQRQDYSHIEHIVIDGGSSDGSIDIIRKHEARLAYWVSEPDRGQTDAANKGFARAKGSIFNQLNSDDLLAPSAVRIAVHTLTSAPAIGVVYGDRLHIDHKGNVIGVLRCPPHDPRMFACNFTIPHEASFFRRELFKQVGGMDEKLHFAMDFDLWCKLSKVTQMRHLPAFLGYYREHEAAKSVVFHEKEGPASREYAEEGRAVYRKHFGRNPPSGLMKRWYRLLWHGRRLLDQASESRRSQVAEIRKLVLGGEGLAVGQARPGPSG